MTRPTPTECWAAGVGTFVVVNGTAWHLLEPIYRKAHR